VFKRLKWARHIGKLREVINTYRRESVLTNLEMEEDGPVWED
jgi:hypothetical protein